MKFPEDLKSLAEMLVETFQYPENPEWGVQDDQQEQIIESMRGLRRLWPAIRLAQAVAPSLRDLFRGFVWEEDGIAAGVVIVQRRGRTRNWNIGTVGVLPAYRRRGIARRLVIAALEDMKARGAALATLGVIEGNLPAQTLYRSLGFEEYGGATVYDLHPANRMEIGRPTLLKGYSESPLGEFDWRPRYDMEKRIAPEASRRFEPIEVARYRQPLLMRLLVPVFHFAQKIREKGYIVYTAGDRVAVGRGGYTLSTSGKGTHSIYVRLDPGHSALAPYMIGRLLHAVGETDRDLRVEFVVPSWMPAVAAAAELHGFKRRMRGVHMGIELSSVEARRP
jgi:ribosomal protein S18 acetylase RimI-like enzyme